MFGFLTLYFYRSEFLAADGPGQIARLVGRR